MEAVAELLDETLQEESATDEKLSELAESEINARPAGKKKWHCAFAGGQKSGLTRLFK
jgi:Domain of unknown function (DUF892)